MSASESNVTSLGRLAAVKKRWRLWRNQRGAGKLDSGNYVRFGLANDSKALGDKLKSGDYIGWRPVIITPGMVGKKGTRCSSSPWNSKRRIGRRPRSIPKTRTPPRNTVGPSLSTVKAVTLYLYLTQINYSIDIPVRSYYIDRT